METFIYCPRELVLRCMRSEVNEPLICTDTVFQKFSHQDWLKFQNTGLLLLILLCFIFHRANWCYRILSITQPENLSRKLRVEPHLSEGIRILSIDISILSLKDVPVATIFKKKIHTFQAVKKSIGLYL